MLSTITAFLDKLEPVDILRAGALVLFFVGTLFIDRRRQTWFQGETVAMAVGGVMWLLVPGILLEIQTSGKPDAVHLYLGHILGAAFLSSACSHGRNDKGENVNLTRIIAGFVASAGMVVGGTYGYLKYSEQDNHFTVQFLTLGGLAMTLWCIGSMIMASRECSNGVGYNNFDDSDRQLIIHQLIDLGIVGLGVAKLVGCPSFINDVVILENLKIDGIHQTLVRGLGSIFMYKFMVALSTLIFQSEEPAVNAEQARDNFLSRLVYIGLACIFAVWYQYAYHLFRTDQVISNFVLAVLWGINSLLGVKAADKEINS